MDEGPQLTSGELAADHLEHPSVDGDEGGGGHAGRAEGVEDHTLGIGGQQVGDVGRVGQDVGRGAAVALVDPEEGDLGTEGLMDLLEIGHLGDAERTA